MGTFKKICKYWGFVFKQSVQIALVESELKNWIRASIIAALGAVVLYIFGKNNVIPQNTPIIGDAINNLSVQGVLGIGSAIIFGVSFFFALVYVPADIHEKQGGFKDNPFRIEIPFLKPKVRGEARCHTLVIHNNLPTKKIKNCYVRLDMICDAKNKKPAESVHKNLMWNADVGEENQCKKIDIEGGGRIVCDVVKEEGQTTVYYLTWDSEKKKKSVHVGEYILCFSVFGDLDELSKPNSYYCKMMVDNNFEVILTDLREGKYEVEKK